MIKKLITTFIFAILISTIGALAIPQNNITTPQVALAQDSGDLDSDEFIFDLNTITHKDIEGSTRQSWIRGGINYIFERIITFLAVTVGGLSVLVMSYGGLMILISAGDENQVTKGKGYIKYAAIGLVATLMAYILVTGVQILIRSIYG
jgi:hypothetical protein